MSTTNRPIRRPSPRYVRFAAILGQSIRARRLQRGTVLLESSLAQILGSSRGPVRQALALLHGDGLLSRFDGRGYVVGSTGVVVRRIELSAEMLDVGADPQRLRSPLAWEGLYEQVERTIIHRSVFGRFRVNEIELARHYGVGRTVARDVLTRLQALGMLTKDDRQRWIIVPLDAERVVNLYEIRRHLEPLALRHAFPMLDLVRLRSMRRDLTRMIKAYPDVTASAMNELEFDLHVRCLAPCPNRELLNALQRTRCVLTLSKHVLGVEMMLPRSEPFMAEHRVVLDAMLDGDEAASLRALRHHLEQSCPKVVDRLAVFRRTFTPPDTTYIDSARDPGGGSRGAA